MMKTRIHTLLPAALLLLTATACEDTLNAPALPAGNGDGPTLTLALDNNEEKAGTRSTLNDGAPVNHVQTVRILVFEGGTEANNYTDATYVGDEVYANGADAIEWPDEKTDKKEYRMNYAFVEGETYTLLGVGQDDEFADTYDIELTEGTTLANAYAKLKSGEGKGKDDIAHCDFYTGTTTFTHEGKNTHIEDLLMKRRVAGVMLYVTEIPQSLTDKNNDNYRITSIKLELGANQKSSVRLQRDFDDLEWTEDGQAELEDSKVVAEITGLENANYNQSKDFYEDEDGTPLTQYAGAYMLPLNKSEDTNYKTFTVTLYGKKFADGGEANGTIADDATEESLKTFTVENRSEEGSPAAFDIRSNYLYSIGKLNPDDGVDEPISLSGRPIYLEVLPFQEMEVNHDFESARIQAVFAPDFNEEKYRFNCINNTFTVKVLPSLFKDKWTITIPDETTAYDVKGKSKTYNTHDNTEMTHWLWIKTGEKTVSKSYTCTDDEKENGATITFVMLDYAVYRPWGWVNHEWNPTTEDIQRINDDVRTVTVALQTIKYDDNGQALLGGRYDYLDITQYNTITVDFESNQDNEEDEIATCGFSRLDWGDRFVKYPTEGHVVENDPTIDDTEIVDYNNNKPKANAYKSSGWGWWTTTSYALYGETNGGSKTNGALNVKKLGENTSGLINENTWLNWYTTAQQRCEVLFSRVEETILRYPDREFNKRTTDKCWYLPSQYEMEGIYRASISSPTLNINTTTQNGTMAGVGWWTSTVHGTKGKQAMGIPSNSPNTNELLQSLDKTNGKSNTDGDSKYENKAGTFMYLRPARQFTRYYQEGEAQNDAWITLPDGQADAEEAAQQP